MNQQALFYETVFDAIGADIAAIGGFKVTAGKLWPSDDVTTSAAKLRNCVNPDQPHKLCPQEVMRIKKLAKDVGSFATVNFEAHELGFEFTWIQAEEQAREIHLRAVAALEAVTRELQRSSKLMEETKTKIRSIK
jgi:hypothetical protein